MATKGRARLIRQMRSLPRLQIEAAGRSNEENAAELANAIARAVPADTGDLAASVGWARAGEAPAISATQAIRPAVSERAQLLGSSGLSVVVFEGNDVAFYARWVEHGTAGGLLGGRTGGLRDRKVYRTHPGSRAQPHFWPTVRANKKRMKSRWVRNANRAAKKAAAVP